MNSNGYLDFLKFIIEVIFLNLVLNILANSIPISPPINRIILFAIALLLTIIVFYLQVVRHQTPNPINRMIFAVIAFFLVILFGTIILPTPENICQPLAGFKNYISTGERSLIQHKNPNEIDREQKIYDNNKDLNETNSYLLAVAIPANTGSEAATAMLAGVADAQAEFNRFIPILPPKSKKQLKIVVVDDQNNKVVIVDQNNERNSAKEVACQIAVSPDWKDVLGVIGHHSSGASKAALEIYAKAGLTMITPTSTSTKLNQNLGKVFFRTTVTNKAFGNKLAAKINSLKDKGKVIVFYEKDNEYAEDLKRNFIESFGDSRIEEPIDIKNWTSADIDKLNIPNEVKTAVIFSSSGDGQKHEIAIKLIKKLKNIRPNDINLFGGDSLYQGRTLAEGNTDIEGLKLVIPWFPVKLDGQIISDYAKKSQATWEGLINWMTASSYDATKAFLEAIAQAETNAKMVNRKTVLDYMQKVDLGGKYTSGDEIKFENGELKEQPEAVIVEVFKKKDLPKILQCSFEVCFKRVE